MDSIDIKSIIAILTFLAGAGSAVLGMLRWFSTSERKKFAAEREFNHLRLNQEQMKLTLAMMGKEVDELTQDMHTQTALLQMMMSNSGQTISGIFAHKPNPHDDKSAD